jgi:hypothetical protein
MKYTTIGLALTGILFVGCHTPSEGKEEEVSQDDTSSTEMSDESVGSCYDDSDAGCQYFTWSEIQEAIETVYLFVDSYQGFTKGEALEVAKIIYENGGYPEAVLALLRVQTTPDDGYRAFLSLTDDEGHPVSDRKAEHFQIVLDDAEPINPASVHRLQEMTSDDISVDASIVIDDSGSMTDCDANFVNQGVAHLFENLPEVYEAHALKFTSEIYPVHDWSRNGSELATALLTTCTDRGATAAWDAVNEGLAVLRHQADLEFAILFSDGLDNSSDTALGTLAAKAQEGATPVFAIGLGMADIFSMQRLAMESGGAFVYISSGEEALSAFELITEYLVNLYVVEWRSVANFDECTVTVTLPGGDALSDSILLEQSN